MFQHISGEVDAHSQMTSSANSSPQDVMQVTDQQFLAAIIESSDDAIIGKTLDGIVTSWNPAAERLYGYTEEEIVGKSITTIIPSELYNDFSRLMEQLKEGRKIDHYETIRVRKDGTRINVSVTISPIKDASGKLIGTSTIARDITMQKKASERLQVMTDVCKTLASSLDYRSTLSKVAQMVVPQLADWFSIDLLDAEGYFELVEVAHNSAKKEQQVEELRKRYLIDLHAPGGPAKVIRTGKSELYSTIADEMLVASGGMEDELALYQQISPTSLIIAPLPVHGDVVGVLSFVSTSPERKYSITDLDVAEELGRRIGCLLDNVTLYEQVKQSRDELQTILQNVADGILVQDAKGTIIYINDRAAQLCGFASVEAMTEHNRSLFDVFNRIETKDEVGNTLSWDQLPGQQALAGEKNVRAVMQHTDILTGRTRWTLVKAEPICDMYGQAQLAVNVMVDITEQHALEQRKDEFIRMASHELKTPITSLKGFASLLQRRLAKQSDEKSISFITRMDAQLDRLTKLVSDLLDVSKIQVGKLEYRAEYFDLDALVRETVENVQETTQTHKLYLESQVNVQVFGDRDRIGQVLINLLTNAIKYSPQADKVIVRVSTSAGHAVLSVQDFGIGIAESHQAHVFERFYQVADSEEKAFPGLGIGLYITHEIVQRHHGQIWVESRRGEGSTFYVSLPLASEEI